MNKGRALFIAFLGLYVISTVIVLIASTSKKQTPPTWGGYLDVGIAITIAIIGFMIFGMNQGALNYETSHRVALYIIPIVLLGMWFFRATFDFNILLPGLAWRTFFFLHILPYGISIWKPEATQ